MAFEKTMQEWFDNRGEMEISVVEGQEGGFDIVLRLDGGYEELADAARIASSIAEQLRAVGVKAVLF